jgi:hypothetical protein
MQYRLLAVVLIGAATLGGCSEGVLDPRGPIASAERQILFNSLGIMLAIVIPTILATLGVAYWFRAVIRELLFAPHRTARPSVAAHGPKATSRSCPKLERSKFLNLLVSIDCGDRKLVNPSGDRHASHIERVA